MFSWLLPLLQGNKQNAIEKAMRYLIDQCGVSIHSCNVVCAILHEGGVINFEAYDEYKNYT